MLSHYLKAPFQFEQREIPIPEVGPDDVLIKVKACGVCGTDMHIFDGDEGAAATPAGTVLGHEFAGEVIAVALEGVDVPVVYGTVKGEIEQIMVAADHGTEEFGIVFE